jgi:hypothetical protein
MTTLQDTPRLQQLNDLLERVEGASGPDADLSMGVVFVAIPAGNVEARRWAWGIGDFTASLDAALGLVERVLPGWKWTVAHHHNMPDCETPDPRPYYADAASAAWIEGETRRKEHAEAFGHTPALALLAALLRAIISNG